MRFVNATTCKTLLERNVVSILDIREKWETDICKIPGSLTVPMHLVADQVETLDKSRSYIIVCKTGKRAQALANLLITDFNFENIQVLEGGITEWYAEFDPNFELY